MDKVAAAIKGKSWTEVAKTTGTTPSFISLLFRGKRNAKVATLARIAKVLGVTLDELATHLSRPQKNGRGYGWRKPADKVA